jgi:hypothetical protein
MHEANSDKLSCWHLYICRTCKPGIGGHQRSPRDLRLLEPLGSKCTIQSQSYTERSPVDILFVVAQEHRRGLCCAGSDLSSCIGAHAWLLPLSRMKPVSLFFHAEHACVCSVELEAEKIGSRPCRCGTVLMLYTGTPTVSVFLLVPLRHFLCTGTVSLTSGDY